MKIEPDEVDLVLYHGSCPDGFSAAWAAHDRLGKKAEYVAVYHGDIPHDCSGRVVALVDFCYSRSDMMKIASEAAGVVVVDHHVSAMKDMEGFDGIDMRFDMEHSGCVLSWQYFNPEEQMPLLLNFVEARDLWRWNVEGYSKQDIKNVLSAFDSREKTFEMMDALTCTKPSNGIGSQKHAIDSLNEEGSTIERFRQKMIKSHVKRAERRRIMGHDAYVVNCTSAELASDVGNELAEEGVMAVMWWFDTVTGQAVVSLRSIGDLDVSIIAKRVGGGGHKNAAGCSMPLSTLLYPI